MCQSMIKQVAVIEGDDAAPEAIRPIVGLISSLNLGIEFLYPLVGKPAEEQFGTPFPDSAKTLLDNTDTCLFGATSTSAGRALHYLRWGKDTYANVRPCRYFEGCASPLKTPDDIDFIIVRENLEDLYVAIEGDIAELNHLTKQGRTIGKPLRELGEGRYAIKAITRTGTERIVRFAFELARKRDRQKLTCVTKHNMLRESDGYFLEIAYDIADEFRDVEFESYIVDDFACRIIRTPQSFDVVVMPNLYGDILSDAAGGLLGSLGLSASGVYGDDYAYFEPAHGTAPDIAGLHIINPTASLLSAGMMLDYLGLGDYQDRLIKAIESVYREGKTLTPDQGGSASTEEFIDAVATAL